MASTEFQPIPFCDNWATGGYDKMEENLQEAYVASELTRLVEEKQPLLRAVMAYGELWVQHLAMRLLRDGATAAGDQCPQVSTVFLRLVEPEALDWTDPNGDTETAVAIPPNRDPQGRPIPRDRVGHVLVCKVGNLGGNLGPERDAKQAEAYGADKRHIAEKARRPLYLTREVTRTAESYSFRDALIILGQWGYGIGETVFAQPRERGGMDGERRYFRGQCRWLVEECTPEQYAQDQAKKRKAQAAKAKEPAPPPSP
jgi:hypothetical protein